MAKIKISILTSLYNCAEFLEQYLKATIDVCDEFIEIILLHNAPRKEELAIIKKYKTHIDNLNHVLISERETLYASWNRGIKMAKGEFITIWNVDDIRSKTGILAQYQVLKNNTHAGLVYGNYTSFFQNFENGNFKKLPDKISKYKKFRRFYGTPFMMWRKSIHEEVGYFDEQFRSAGDFDFWIRVARMHQIMKADANLGYFLAGQNLGISKTGNINNVERTVIELRYGIFDKLDYFFIHHALKYSITKLNFSGQKKYIGKYFFSYKYYILVRTPLVIVSVFRFPFYSFFPKFFKYLKQIKKIGLKNTIQAISSKLKKIG